MIEAMRSLIEDVCNYGTGPFDADFYAQHILVMAGVADALAVMLHADREVVALAAYLHDIAAVEDYGSVAKHHILGADRAAAILKDRGCAEDTIFAVRRCILSHPAPLSPGHGTPEEVAISNADAVSQILRPGYWLRYGTVAKNLGYRDSLISYKNRIQSHWAALIPEAKPLASDVYHGALALFAAEWGT
jgi:uncharacterized protein